VFDQTLVTEGINKEDARDLAEAYPDPVEEILMLGKRAELMLG
jgi:hypothetical protein